MKIQKSTDTNFPLWEVIGTNIWFYTLKTAQAFVAESDEKTRDEIARKYSAQ